MRYLLFTFLLVSTTAYAENHIYSPNIQSLTSTVNDDWRNRPVMTLGSDDIMTIGFDEMSHETRRYICKLKRCEPDWTESTDVFESNWLEGTNTFFIDDYQHSLNTTVDYTHYSLQIPNEQWKIRMSGNYRLTVYDEEQGDDAVLDVEFYIVEQVIGISMEMTTNTDIDQHQSHQQLNIEITYNGLPITRPDEEISTIVMQNWRTMSARKNLQPSYIHHRGLRWEHHPGLIFNGGNEHHKFEVLNVSHITMGLERLIWDGEFYQAYPTVVVARTNYLTDISANGACKIRNSENLENDYTCDYVWVNYRLQADYMGDISIDGLWTNHHADYYRMSYDNGHHCYHGKLLQKQGYYSYQLIDSDGHLAQTEGNFYQTQNSYQMFVYYKTAADRSWRLLGYRGINCNR